VNGSCPKSYGTNVARLAGLPEVVVKRAAEFAAMLEAREVDGTTVPSSALVQEELTDSEKSLLRELGTLLGAPGSAEDMNLALLQFQESLSA
jgi:DNA mismatch repair ATPase MutS